MARVFTGRKSGVILRGGRMRRETSWLFLGGTATTMNTSSTAVLVGVLNATALALRPFTVVRTRGYLYLHSDQAASAELQAANWGICVVSQQASAIGITAVPTPTTDQGSDLWFVFQSIMAAHGAGTVDSEQGKAVEYDSRAMRKVEVGQDLALVAETEVAGLTGGVILRHTGRMLVKLH